MGLRWVSESGSFVYSLMVAMVVVLSPGSELLGQVQGADVARESVGPKLFLVGVDAYGDATTDVLIGMIETEAVGSLFLPVTEGEAIHLENAWRSGENVAWQRVIEDARLPSGRGLAKWPTVVPKLRALQNRLSAAPGGRIPVNFRSIFARDGQPGADVEGAFGDPEALADTLRYRTNVLSVTVSHLARSVVAVLDVAEASGRCTDGGISVGCIARRRGDMAAMTTTVLIQADPYTRFQPGSFDNVISVNGATCPTMVAGVRHD